MAKKTLGDRPNNEGWGPGRTHGDTQNDGPPKGDAHTDANTDAPAEDLHRRGDDETTQELDVKAEAPAEDRDQETFELPKRGISIPAHLRAAYEAIKAFLLALVAKGYEATGEKVWNRLSSAAPAGIVAALIRGRSAEEICRAFASENEAGEFAPGLHGGGVNFRIWSVLGVPFVHPVHPSEVPNALPAAPSGGLYKPTRNGAEAIARLDLDNVGAPGWAPVGWAGNGLVPDQVAREYYAIRRRFDPEFAGPTSPAIDPAWAKVRLEVALVACAGGIASLFSPAYADIYAPMETGNEVLAYQPYQGPSGA